MPGKPPYSGAGCLQATHPTPAWLLPGGPQAPGPQGLVGFPMGLCRSPSASLTGESEWPRGPCYTLAPGAQLSSLYLHMGLERMTQVDGGTWRAGCPGAPQDPEFSWDLSFHARHFHFNHRSGLGTTLCMNFMHCTSSKNIVFIIPKVNYKLT